MSILHSLSGSKSSFLSSLNDKGLNLSHRVVRLRELTELKGHNLQNLDSFDLTDSDKDFKENDNILSNLDFSNSAHPKPPIEKSIEKESEPPSLIENTENIDHRAGPFAVEKIVNRIMDNPSMYDMLETFYFDYHEIFDSFSNILKTLRTIQRDRTEYMSNKSNELDPLVRTGEESLKKFEGLKAKIEAILECHNNRKILLTTEINLLFESMRKELMKWQERKIKNKRKHEQIKINFELRELELKKELNLYKKHLEDGKKLWNEQMKLLANSMKQNRKMKKQIVNCHVNRMNEIERDLNDIISNGTKNATVAIASPLLAKNLVMEPDCDLLFNSNLNSKWKLEEHKLSPLINSQKINRSYIFSEQKLDYNSVMLRLKRLLGKVKNFQTNIPEKNPLESVEKEGILVNLGDSEKLSSPASSSAELNQAFIQQSSREHFTDASIGSLFKTSLKKSLSNSIQSNSTNPINLDEQQIIEYFGSQYNLLSISQREKIVFSIINKSANLENPLEAKLQDLLDVSKIKSCNTTPTNQQNKNKKFDLQEIIISDSPKNFPNGISPIMSPICDNLTLGNHKKSSATFHTNSLSGKDGKIIIKEIAQIEDNNDIIFKDQDFHFTSSIDRSHNHNAHISTIENFQPKDQMDDPFLDLNNGNEKKENLENEDEENKHEATLDISFNNINDKQDMMFVEQNDTMEDSLRDFLQLPQIGKTHQNNKKETNNAESGSSKNKQPLEDTVDDIEQIVCIVENDSKSIGESQLLDQDVFKNKGPMNEDVIDEPQGFGDISGIAKENDSKLSIFTPEESSERGRIRNRRNNPNDQKESAAQAPSLEKKKSLNKQDDNKKHLNDSTFSDLSEDFQIKEKPIKPHHKAAQLTFNEQEDFPFGNLDLQLSPIHKETETKTGSESALPPLPGSIFSNEKIRNNEVAKNEKKRSGIRIRPERKMTETEDQEKDHEIVMNSSTRLRKNTQTSSFKNKLNKTLTSALEGIVRKKVNIPKRACTSNMGRPISGGHFVMSLKHYQSPLYKKSRNLLEKQVRKQDISVQLIPKDNDTGKIMKSTSGKKAFHSEIFSDQSRDESLDDSLLKNLEKIDFSHTDTDNENKNKSPSSPLFSNLNLKTPPQLSSPQFKIKFSPQEREPFSFSPIPPSTSQANPFSICSSNEYTEKNVSQKNEIEATASGKRISTETCASREGIVMIENKESSRINTPEESKNIYVLKRQVQKDRLFEEKKQANKQKSLINKTFDGNIEHSFSNEKETNISVDGKMKGLKKMPPAHPKRKISPANISSNLPIKIKLNPNSSSGIPQFPVKNRHGDPNSFIGLSKPPLIKSSKVGQSFERNEKLSGERSFSSNSPVLVLAEKGKEIIRSGRTTSSKNDDEKDCDSRRNCERKIFRSRYCGTNSLLSELERNYRESKLGKVNSLPNMSKKEKAMDHHSGSLNKIGDDQNSSIQNHSFYDFTFYRPISERTETKPKSLWKPNKMFSPTPFLQFQKDTKMLSKPPSGNHEKGNPATHPKKKGGRKFRPPKVNMTSKNSIFSLRQMPQSQMETSIISHKDSYKNSHNSSPPSEFHKKSSSPAHLMQTPYFHRREDSNGNTIPNKSPSTSNTYTSASSANCNNDIEEVLNNKNTQALEKLVHENKAPKIIKFTRKNQEKPTSTSPDDFNGRKPITNIVQNQSMISPYISFEGNTFGSDENSGSFKDSGMPMPFIPVPIKGIISGNANTSMGNISNIDISGVNLQNAKVPFRGYKVAKTPVKVLKKVKLSPAPGKVSPGKSETEKSEASDSENKAPKLFVRRNNFLIQNRKCVSNNQSLKNEDDRNNGDEVEKNLFFKVPQLAGGNNRKKNAQKNMSVKLIPSNNLSFQNGSSDAFSTPQNHQEPQKIDEYLNQVSGTLFRKPSGRMLSASDTKGMSKNKLKEKTESSATIATSSLAKNPAVIEFIKRNSRANGNIEQTNGNQEGPTKSPSTHFFRKNRFRELPNENNSGGNNSPGTVSSLSPISKKINFSKKIVISGIQKKNLSTSVQGAQNQNPNDSSIGIKKPQAISFQFKPNKNFKPNIKMRVSQKKNE